MLQGWATLITDEPVEEKKKEKSIPWSDSRWVNEMLRETQAFPNIVISLGIFQTDEVKVITHLYVYEHCPANFASSDFLFV